MKTIASNVVWVFILMFGLASCHLPGTFFVRSIPAEAYNINTLMQLSISNPYIIGHYDSMAFRIVNPEVSADGNAVVALTLELPSDRYMYKYLGNRRKGRPYPGLQKPTDELHVYLKSMPVAIGDTIRFSKHDLRYYQVYQLFYPEKGGNTAGKKVGENIVIITVVTALVVGAIGYFISTTLP